MLRFRPSACLVLATLGAFALGCSSLRRNEPEAAVTTQGDRWLQRASERLPMLEPCDVAASPERLLCGTVDVPADRSRPDGGRIGLKVVVVPAQSDDPPADPVFVFEGGPGGAATGRALGSVYAGPVRQRDIVLVDQRGTGGSNPLDCAWDAAFREGELREIFPVDSVRACAAELAERTDVSLYTTDHFTDDIEEVRQRLGYGPLNLRGGSYGTRSMMTFAQRHPDSVRTLFGIGLDSPLRSNLAERGVWTDRTLERLSELCAVDASCSRVTTPVPLYEMTAALITSLAAAGRRVELADPMQPEEGLVVEVGRDWMTEQLRLMLYFAFTSRALPWAVHSAYEDDDWRPLVAMAVMIERMFRGALAHGLVLTVQCSEMMHFDVDAALERGAATLFGNYRLEQQLQGCAEWPHEPRPPLGVVEPRVLEVPALLLSGALDPVTPPEYGEEVRELFPNSAHVVIEEGQHGPFDLENSWECVHQVWGELLDRGSVEGLDLSCFETLARPPFVTDGQGFDEYLAEVLVPSVGG